VCRQLGVSEATFYAWKKKYAHLGVSELRRLRQLEDENNRLKRLVADLALDKLQVSCVRASRLACTISFTTWEEPTFSASRSGVLGVHSPA
jgi:putative transposase